MRQVPLANNGVVCWPRRTLEEADEEAEPIHLVRCLSDRQTTCEDAPEQLVYFSIIAMMEVAPI